MVQLTVLVLRLAVGDQLTVVLDRVGVPENSSGFLQWWRREDVEGLRHLRTSINCVVSVIVVKIFKFCR